MVKVLVNGGLFEISKVEEIVEKRVPFNGTNIRLVQIAKDSKQAVSGLHFQVKNTECNVFAISEFTIGNLPTAKVKETMEQLLQWQRIRTSDTSKLSRGIKNSCYIRC